MNIAVHMYINLNMIPVPSYIRCVGKHQQRSVNDLIDRFDRSVSFFFDASGWTVRNPSVTNVTMSIHFTNSSLSSASRAR